MTLRHIKTESLRISAKGKILKAYRRDKIHIIYEGTKIKINVISHHKQSKRGW